MSRKIRHFATLRDNAQAHCLVHGVRLVTAGFDISGWRITVPAVVQRTGDLQARARERRWSGRATPMEKVSACELRTAPSMGRADHAIPACCGPEVARQGGMKGITERTWGGLAWSHGIAKRPSPGGSLAVLGLSRRGVSVGQKRAPRRSSPPTSVTPAVSRHPNRRTGGTGVRVSPLSSEPTTVIGMLSHIIC